MSIPSINAFFAKANPIACIKLPKKAKSRPKKTIFFSPFLLISDIDIPNITKKIPKRTTKSRFSFKNMMERRRVIKGEEVKISIVSWGPIKRKLLNKKRSPKARPTIPLNER